MLESGSLLSAQSIQIFHRLKPANRRTSHKFLPHTFNVVAASKRNEPELMRKKGSRAPRRLITISTAEGRWHGKWNCDYLLTLEELRLADLVEDDQQKDAEVHVNLCVQKHASFGFSVEGRIVTAFTRKCSVCSSPYCRQIDTNFNVWVLASSRDNHALQIPEIGDDDPSVIYVKPGYEADFDSLIQDTIRLTTSAKDTCSELCEKSETTIQCTGARNMVSPDKRWSRLLKLKTAKS